MTLENPYSKKNQWYFYDESQEEYGPFISKEAAQTQLNLYIETELRDTSKKEIKND